MIDAGDLFMVQWIPGERKEGNYLMMVVEPHHVGSGWMCEICNTGKQYFYYHIDIEEGKKYLQQYIQRYARVV